MASRPWCSVCQAHYRGIYPVHASGATHLGKVRRRAIPSFAGTRNELRRALGDPVINVRRMLAGDNGEGRERVRAHRRSPPNDGTRKIVKVIRYWRWPPYRGKRWS
jgi:hypothetical protein